MNAYQKLKTVFSGLANLNYLQQIMVWDESVMMPEGAGASRAEALAALSGMLQKKLVTGKNKKLLVEAKQQDGLSQWDKANLKRMEKNYLRAACIPQRLTEKLTKETFVCQQAWRKYREQNNWRSFAPHLKRVFKLVKEVNVRRADVLQLSLYDELLDEYATGFNQEKIDKIFSGLKKEMPELMQKVMDKQSSEKIIAVKGSFPIEKQRELGIDAMKVLQFDFNQGRLDVSHHPFCGGYPTDVRITTRYRQDEFLSSLMGICHETGHGLYEQGLPREWIEQPVGRMDSMAMHESQSLLIEKQICGSKAFYQFLLPKIQEKFGMQDAFTVDNLFKIATRVESSFIRVDADEVTYPLHIILRYEIEKNLFNGTLDIADLPSAWNELMMKYLNISTEKNNKDGVMQDVHWPSGAFGYFPAYTLGRLIAAQLFATFIKKFPMFFAELEQGNFGTLKKWLQENVYSYASSISTEDLLLKVTGKTLDPNYFLEHVRERYL